MQFIQRPGLCRGQQAERGVRCASLVLGLRRGQRPLGAARRVERQPGGPLQERGRRREAAAALGPACALLKFGGDFLIRAGAASARCQARRSGSAAGSVASASAPCSSCLVWADADR